MLLLSLAVVVGMCGSTETYAPNTVLVKCKDTPRIMERGNLQHRFHSGWEKWRVEDDVMETVHNLRQRGCEAEPDYLVTADIRPNDPYITGFLQNGDTTSHMQNLRDDQPPDADISAEQAWDIETGDPSVVIVDIDTGLDYRHPDLSGKLWTNPGEIPGDGLDNDGNGYIDDIHGYDFDNDDGDPFDDNGHGTHTAGTVGAATNNGIAVAGVCWGCSIMPLKFLDCGGRGLTSDAIRAIDYATMMHAQIANNSWGGGGFSQALFDSIAGFTSGGGLFIASAGNNARNTDLSPAYPADYDIPTIISVAATDPNDGLASFSNWGLLTVDLAAPGVLVNSTWRLKDCRKQGILDRDCIGSLSGTSMSAPHVSGVAGLLLSHDPTMTAAEIKAAILASVDPVAALAGKSVTGGRLNAFKALGGPPPQPTEICGNGVCAPPENCINCPARSGKDCPGNRKQCCGNGVVERGENGDKCDGNP